MAEVDPEHGRAAGVGDLGGAQDGAVAADDDGELAVRRRGRTRPSAISIAGSNGVASRSRSRASSASSRTTMPWPVRALQNARATSRASARPVWASSSTRRSRRSVSVTGQPSHPAPPTACPARTASLDPGRRRPSAGPRRSHRKNSTFPDGPGSGLVVTIRAPQPRGRSRVGDTDDRLRPQRGVADHAALADPVLADLELRLDHQRQVAVGCGHRQQRVEHQRQRDEGQVAHHEVDRATDQARGSGRGRWCGRAPHPLVLLQPPGELAVAHVDRDDLARRRAAAARR